MKKTIVKRLMYTNGYGEEIIGSVEYDGSLDDWNILGAVHEVGKTKWIGESLCLLRDGVPKYRITVGTFPQYTKRWNESLFDAIKRIRGI